MHPNVCERTRWHTHTVWLSQELQELWQQLPQAAAAGASSPSSEVNAIMNITGNMK
jgi:hypothetical protein